MKCLSCSECGKPGWYVKRWAGKMSKKYAYWYVGHYLTAGSGRTWTVSWCYLGKRPDLDKRHAEQLDKKAEAPAKLDKDNTPDFQKLKDSIRRRS